MADRAAIAGYALEQYRDYLRLLASQHLAAQFRGKVAPSGLRKRGLRQLCLEMTAVTPGRFDVTRRDRPAAEFQ